MDKQVEHLAHNTDAFVLRMSHVDQGLTDEAIASGQIFIGWADASAVSANQSWEEFRQVVYDKYHASDPSMRAAGAAAGNLWKFIVDMKVGDLVVIPRPKTFLVGQITGAAFYAPERAAEDTAWRRPVNWLAGGKPIPRTYGSVALVSRMKSYHTCTSASDLVTDIKRSVQRISDAVPPSLREELQTVLTTTALQQLRRGRMDPNGFERLVARALIAWGAHSAQIIPRRLDIGADIRAEYFPAGGSEPITGLVQVKHYDGETPIEPEVIEKLVDAADSADEIVAFCSVITTGVFSEEAKARAEELSRNRSVTIMLIDGEEFSRKLTDSGLDATLLNYDDHV